MTTPIKKLPSWVLDSKLTPAARAQGERDERNVALVDERYERARREGPKVDVSGAGQMGATTIERLVEDSIDDPNAPIIPVDVKVGPEYPGGFHYILSKRDFERVRLGYNCERCLERLPVIDTPTCPTCEWPRSFIHRDRF